MAWGVEYTSEFGAWWDGLSIGEQTDVRAVVGLLEEKGLRCVAHMSARFQVPNTQT
jgi:hypothetical protein